MQHSRDYFCILGLFVVVLQFELRRSCSKVLTKQDAKTKKLCMLQRDINIIGCFLDMCRSSSSSVSFLNKLSGVASQGSRIKNRDHTEKKGNNVGP